MTSQQKQLINTLLLAVANAKTIDQVSMLWSTLELACRQAGVKLGTKPTSLPQARSLATALKNRLSREST